MKVFLLKCMGISKFSRRGTRETLALRMWPVKRGHSAASRRTFRGSSSAAPYAHAFLNWCAQRTLRSMIGCFIWMTIAAYASAHEGHKHDEKPVATQSILAPRVEAHSELFELVGILDHENLKIYLDRYTDNAPVINAKIEVESGPLKWNASSLEDGTFSIPAAAFNKAGSYPLIFTVNAGGENDLLEGTLEIAADYLGTASDNHLLSRRFVKYALLAQIILFPLLGFYLWRRRRLQRRFKLGK